MGDKGFTEGTNKITMGFTLADEFGNTYKSLSILDLNAYETNSPLDLLGMQFNTFLKQCGYSRTNDWLLMEDLTEDEVYALSDYLDELRDSCEETEED